MANTTIKLKVEDENIVFTSSPPVFSGDVNTISAVFEFGANWDGLTKYAVFYRTIDKPYKVALPNDECLVPHEVMQTSGRMYIGVYGTADNKQKTSEVVFYDLGTGVLAGGMESGDTLSLWQEILKKIDDVETISANVEQYVQQAVDAAGTATAKATEASEYASTASQKATEAATSESNAFQYKTDAESAKTQAESAKAGAENARDQAETNVQNAIDEMTADISASINDALSPRIVENATGETVTVDDASGARLAGLKLYGKSVQNITKGKNLCSVADIEISGSQTVSLDEIPAGTYTISAVVTSTDTDANECLMMFYYTDSNTKEINIGRSTGDTRVSVSVKFDKPVNKVRVYASTAHGTSSGDTASVNDLQIESGSTATAYEVYTDGQPSPTNPVPIESVESPTVSVYGENLVNVGERTYESKGVTFTSKDGAVQVSGTATAESSIRINIPFLPKGTYFVSGGKGDILVRLAYRKTGESYKYAMSGTSVTIDDEDTFLFQVYVLSGKTANDTVYPMFIRGESALPFVQYTEQTLATQLNLNAVPVQSGGNYTDEDGQQWIADVADFGTGKITRYTHTGIYDGSEDEPWRESVINKCFYMQSNNLQLDIQPSSNAICSHLPYVAFNEFNTNLNIDGVTVDINPWIRCRYTSISSLADWRQWLSENPITIIFLLSTPTTEDIPAEVMQAYKALHTNAGTTNVFTNSDPQAGIGLDYVADTKSYIDKRIDAIASTLINNVTGD